ncbi:phosphate starvation-inducible protein PhoH [Paenisporosarcina quisquiliarum]|jgi:phosphate starvation-inducible protein PhoH and related proteins|uniref:PhoH-like protein n=1 Tax=Psychrobacillus psychrodurans TaxID=126157 RepID=A0A9X3LBG3_9BACI|nr:PhoH family protein [Psychrobacillus psychrodurans]SEM47718.1 phosphate starvation-inducible protein PhoH [Paenisporosarcina quisquiliarum]MCK1998968.1 PhoH family protein [Psychrobacillus psychrodurans]MCZ8534908.1 PhoH family protein [Psychrobacillus psychrodurans]MCZ8541498.1 PhoH family protein [Psychrobacillus psychrodurans]SFN03404.1 phosphate starvation-inducible protein PhoH [Psychrobacillus psychrodurans]
MSETKQLDINLQDPAEAVMLLGISDKNVKLIEAELKVQLITRGEQIQIIGEEKNVEDARQLMIQLLAVIRKGININLRDVSSAIEMSLNGTIEYFSSLYDEEIARNTKGKAIRAKTIGQREYIQGIRHTDLTFGIGPAGTGKTYLAVVMATQALKNAHVKKIILTRPAVEAGESLGFLPGDLKEKVDPYLRPLYDALHDVLGTEQTDRLMERGTIEIAPLAYMRGRTLDDAFVILDEAQNTTKAQMKMFLTRLGFGSKMVITGDKTQIDLPKGAESGLIVTEKILKNVAGIHFQYLEQGDVVRHPLVAKIIQAYEEQ